MASTTPSPLTRKTGWLGGASARTVVCCPATTSTVTFRLVTATAPWSTLTAGAHLGGGHRHVKDGALGRAAARRGIHGVLAVRPEGGGHVMVGLAHHLGEDHDAREVLGVLAELVQRTAPSQGRDGPCCRRRKRDRRQRGRRCGCAARPRATVARWPWTRRRWRPAPAPGRAGPCSMAWVGGMGRVASGR